MKRSCARALLAGLLLGGGSGCVTLNTYQSANTLGKGHYELSVSAAVDGWNYVSSPGGCYQTCGQAIPQGDLSARYGVADAIDVGLRVGPAGLEVLGKFQLSSRDNSRVAVSFAPSIGGFVSPVDPTTRWLNTTLPLLIGLNFGAGHQLVLSPKVIALTTNYSLNYNNFPSAQNALLAGTGVGVLLRLTDRFSIMPEASFLYPAAMPSNLVTSGSQGYLIFQFGVGFLFGSPDRLPRR
jgi:hypothetical protein